MDRKSRERRVEKIPCFYDSVNWPNSVRKESFLKRVDQLMDVTGAGCENDNIYFEDEYMDLFGVEPMMWKSVDCSRRLSYGYVFAKMLLTWYLTLPQIPEDIKEQCRGSSTDGIMDYEFINIGYNTAACLDKILLAYVDTLHMWKRSSYEVVISDWNSEADGWNKIIECFPEWIRPAYEKMSIDEFAVCATSMIAEDNGGVTANFEVWESSELYEVIMRFLTTHMALDEEESELCAMLSDLDSMVFRKIPEFDVFNGGFLIHERKTVAICDFNGYEMVGDGMYMSELMMPQRYRYNYTCIEKLGRLKVLIEKRR